jgi:hypothetical protein
MCWKNFPRGIAILTSANIFSLFSVSYVFFIIDFGSTFYSVSNRIKFSIYYISKKIEKNSVKVRKDGKLSTAHSFLF